MINYTQLLTVIPIFGAIVGFFLRKTPKRLIGWFLIVTTLILLALLLVPALFINQVSAMPPPTFLIAFGGCLAVLGRWLESTPPSDLFEILILMGLGFGFLWNSDFLGLIFLAGIFALLILIQSRAGSLSNQESRWVSALYGAAILCLTASPLLFGPTRQIVLLLAYATLLPLFPLHGAYTTLLGSLPGALPAFLSLFLPALGLHGLLSLQPMLSPEIKQTLLLCAVLGIVTGTLRSLVQRRISQILSQTALIFWSILWCYLTISTVEPRALLIFSSAVGLALCGLFLGWHGLRSRYGNLTLDQFSGLGSVMPRFSVLFSLLTMAAMGLPLFGVFSGFTAMAFSVSVRFSWPLFFTLMAWFFVSWRIPSLMEGLLFGKANPNWIHRDFGMREIAALSLILIVLFILGVAPHTLFGLEHLPNLSATRVETG